MTVLSTKQQIVNSMTIRSTLYYFSRLWLHTSC